MKKYTILLLCFCMNVSNLSLAHILQTTLDDISLEDLATVTDYLSEQDHNILIDNADLDYVYIPDTFKAAIKQLKKTHADFDIAIDVSSLLLNETTHVAPEEMVIACVRELMNALGALESAQQDSIDSILTIVREYMRDLESGDAYIFSEESGDEDESVRRKKRTKTYCNLLVRNCLRAGALQVTGDAVIDGTITVNGTVINNNDMTSFNFPRGQNGQLFIGVTGGNAMFGTITSPDGTMSFVPGAGTLDLISTPVFGNVARVDQIFGNDSTGAVSGGPFKTITAALAAAGAYTTASKPVVVWVFPGVYSDLASSPETFPLTIPDNVSLVGLSMGGSATVGGVTIEQLDAGEASTELIVMGMNTLIENVNIQMTGSSTSSFTGIAIPAGAATINRILLNVTDTANGALGIVASGDAVVNIDTSTITASAPVFSRGIYVEQSANVVISNSQVNALAGGASGDYLSSLSNVSIGVETVDYGTCTANASILSGVFYDISQTSGTITLAGTTLAHSAANRLGFKTTISPTILSWATLSNTFAGLGTSSGYMSPGTLPVNTIAIISNRATIYSNGVQRCLVKDLYAATTAPVTSANPLFGALVVDFNNTFNIGLNLVFPATSANITNRSELVALGNKLAIQVSWFADPTSITNFMISVVIY